MYLSWHCDIMEMSGEILNDIEALLANGLLPDT